MFHMKCALLAPTNRNEKNGGCARKCLKKNSRCDRVPQQVF